uniref:Uncharacterized protein n=1 Tax=Tanacetum cinerariifolium TaxID=118510 RepID=A0A6L2JG20_TANCI|nr:hypothetical protein [Tanacetum cinerariifolium]
MRYVDTKCNRKELRLCILKGPYVMIEINIPAKPATETEEAVPIQNVLETYKNTCPENRTYFDSKAEAIHMILSGIGDDIYSTVDACTTVKEFGKLTLRDGESIESYYSRFYKMMNEMIQKSLALIAKHFKRIYKPTNNNLRTLSITRNKNMDTSLRNKNDN